MTKDKVQLLRDLSDAVLEMNEAAAARAAQEIIANGIDAFEGIEQGLADGMERAGRLFEAGEYFIPELLICSDAMYAGLDILKPHLKTTAGEKKHKIVIGVVEGDTHDIGKNIVKIMLETAGFDIHDLGRDVPAADFVKHATEIGASVIAVSTLMTTTMDGMQEIINLLQTDGSRNRFKVIIGGGPISPAFADRIGADAYAANAAEAVRKVKLLVGETG